MTQSFNLKDSGSWRIFESQREFKVLLQQAFELQQKKQYPEAEKVYRQILQDNPDTPAVLNLLGVLLHQTGRHDQAVELLTKADALKPDDDEILNNLGAAYRGQKNWDAAADCFKKSIALNQYYWQSFANLALTEYERKNPQEALEAAETALALDSTPVNMHKVIGDSCMALKDWAKAEKHFRIHVESYPEDAEALNNLAFSCEHNKKWEEAAGLYQRAFSLRPDSYELGLHYGNILIFYKHYAAACEIYKKALEAKPQHLPTYVLIIQSLLYQHKLDEAFLYCKMMETLPDYETGHYKPLRDRIYEYIFAYDEDVEKDNSEFLAFEKVPVAVYPTILLNYIKYAVTEEKTVALSNYLKKYGEAMDEAASHMELKNTLKPVPRPHKKIRLGLLSSDMRTHVVCKFLMPLIRGYNSDLVEIRGYSPLKQVEDRYQKEIREKVHEFHFVERKHNDEIADLILSHDNDILIDLNGYTADSRLNIMSRRLAPVQMEWIGYPFTTGLKTMDYMIFDRYNQPEVKGYGSEESLVMPNSYVCYIIGEEPEFDPTPAFEKNGYITFGTFNNPNKYTPTIIQSWAKCLLAVPESKFLFTRPEASSILLQDNLRREFSKHGVDPERIQFMANPFGQHLQLYRNLDISLDVFPLTGGTTTCEAMSMGVPVVSRYGPFHHSRLSRSFISNVGLPELCADNEDGFVNIAANLASNTDLLRWLHKNLRPVMTESPLCNQELFNSDFESALQTLVRVHGLR